MFQIMKLRVALKMQQLGYKTLPMWQDSLKQYIENDLSEWLKKNIFNEIIVFVVLLIKI